MGKVGWGWLCYVGCFGVGVRKWVKGGGKKRDVLGGWFD